MLLQVPDKVAVKSQRTLLDTNHAGNKGFVVSPASVHNIRVIGAGVIPGSLHRR